MSQYTSTAALEAASDAVLAMGAHVSVHTGSPGRTGANEATGGSYARVATTWVTGDAADGVNTGSKVTINVPAGTFTHFGIWSAATGGTYIDGGELSPNLTLSAAGQIDVNPTHTQS